LGGLFFYKFTEAANRVERKAEQEEGGSIITILHHSVCARRACRQSGEKRSTSAIRDVKGALVYRVEGNYTKGNNQAILKKNDLGASGVMYYTLETHDFTSTKKKVVLQN